MSEVKEVNLGCSTLIMLAVIGLLVASGISSSITKLGRVIEQSVTCDRDG